MIPYFKENLISKKVQQKVKGMDFETALGNLIDGNCVKSVFD